MSVDKNEDQFVKLTTMLESMEEYDRDDEDDLEEGVLGDIAAKAGNIAASATKDVVSGLAKGVVDGVLGTKDVRLMKTASKAFLQVLRNNGINTTEQKVSNKLSKIIARSILKKREGVKGDQKESRQTSPDTQMAKSSEANPDKPNQKDNNIKDDAISALITLGMKKSEASAKVINSLKSNPNSSLEDIIKQSLK